jgi:hypothetical protein
MTCHRHVGVVPFSPDTVCVLGTRLSARAPLDDNPCSCSQAPNHSPDGDTWKLAGPRVVLSPGQQGVGAAARVLPAMM